MWLCRERVAEDQEQEFCFGDSLWPDRVLLILLTHASLSVFRTDDHSS